MNRYIVVFKSAQEGETGVAATDDEIESLSKDVEASGGTITHRYTSRIIRGFSGAFSEEMRKQLEETSTVKYVEPDGPVSI